MGEAAARDRAGEKTFIDFSGDGIDVVHPLTGVCEKAVLFVAVLGASNLTYVEPVLHQDLATWVGCVGRLPRPRLRLLRRHDAGLGARQPEGRGDSGRQVRPRSQPDLRRARAPLQGSSDPRAASTSLPWDGAPPSLLWDRALALNALHVDLATKEIDSLVFSIEYSPVHALHLAFPEVLNLEAENLSGPPSERNSELSHTTSHERKARRRHGLRLQLHAHGGVEEAVRPLILKKANLPNLAELRESATELHPEIS